MVAYREYSPPWCLLISYCFSFHSILNVINILTCLLWITAMVKQVVTSYSCGCHFDFSRVRKFQIFIETAMQANSYPLRVGQRWGSPKLVPSPMEDRNYGFELSSFIAARDWSSSHSMCRRHLQPTLSFETSSHDCESISSHGEVVRTFSP